MEAAQSVGRLHLDPLNHFLIEVVQQLLMRAGLGFANLALQLLLKLVELQADLLRRAALLVDIDDALLEVDARLDRTQYLIAGPEDTLKELELLCKQLLHANIRCVRPVRKVHHNDIELLAVAMATAKALLNPLRVPRKIVVDDQIAELKIDPLGRCFRGNHDAGFIAEEIDQRGALIGCNRAGDAIRPLVAMSPVAIDALAKLIGVGTIEKNYFAGKLGVLQQGEEIILGAAGFGKDQCLLLDGLGPLAVHLFCFAEARVQCREKLVALGIVLDLRRKRVKLTQFHDLLTPLLALLGGQLDWPLTGIGLA